MADGRFFAPAKINLALHVTGRRDDGYHMLSSLVAFADVGDWVTASPADDWSLTVDGPFAEGVPTDDSNLVLKAAMATDGPPAAFTLEKNLPPASGIGGGTADAAAALRALWAMDGRAFPGAPERIGADLPVCLLGRAGLMEGIGERVEPLPALPPLHAVLVNPGVAVGTGDVFRGLTTTDNAPLPRPAPWSDARALAEWLSAQRNDLEDPARSACPAIGVVLARLQATEPLIARMSGSGATCFALYTAAPQARVAAETLAAAHPGWWVRATALA
ncbi:4-(cytidine 5'-diphospho)-2-C-methyl-D-erythritol kinase [Palleronia pelagia]|uniref:4-diphosphocytidyl-2-C-methyl-D-erythritol kinase n=1 Tax=Palleronia pelagia TaxID=387096 RepID=A0A1H8J5Y5_9RHOB|nr:4-(cytidine 5'-diphospho)-2-C-methyl-D-erythritol kinase [Palleronia pelagia]SEN75865.1 4-diphosphocytidyl-2-C-methyl-D-erythritol kinase [Palleronia pelagia]